MKRAGFLVGQIADMNNLYLAFWKAKRGKSTREGVLNYQTDLLPNLQSLSAEIMNGTLQLGNYHYFTVYEPKERKICAASFKERVLHHALMNVCHPYFERRQIFDSYASRPQKGIHAALRRAQQFGRRYEWYLKLDVRHFFDSIDHDIVKQQLSRLFKDTQLLDIWHRILDSYEVQPGKGVPIGNLSSQYISNHYLSGIDRYAYQVAGAQGYVRYMDDMILWHNDKNALLSALSLIEGYLHERLKLRLKPAIVGRTAQGLPFLGFVVRRFDLGLQRAGKQRYYKKLKRLCCCLKHQQLSPIDFQRRVQCLASFVRHARSLKFRQKTVRRLRC
ncbi:MAG: group II intron reverse transcriptase domain-containing protein [Sphingobacteriales bacterium]|nr:group II intron reverse transcriptase domain-containing protein [Sphingobacteriales bacterium]MCC7224584.1 group II intron reverse transcriptase domain-containing protein [Chitinophagales bacterium]